MRDTDLVQLMLVVERAVRPVRATIARKRRMRDELLGHLVAIFADEQRRCGDEQAALEAAKGRFGEPRELTDELRSTVPRWDRIGYWTEKMQYQPGESLLHFAGKHLLFTFAACCIVLPIVLLIWTTKPRQDELQLLVCVMATALAWGVGPVMAIELFGVRLRRVWSEGEAKQPLRLAALYAAASLPILPVGAFVTYWALSGDLASSLLHLRFACGLAPVAAALLLILGRKRAEEMRYEDEWASLEVED